jgi:hypothetical protein
LAVLCIAKGSGSGDASLIAAFFGTTWSAAAAQNIQPRNLLTTIHSQSQSLFLLFPNWHIGQGFYPLDIIAAFPTALPKNSD